MKLTKEEFEKLQGEWYGKLEQLGFKDIEIKKDGCFVLRQCSTHGIQEMHPLDRETKEIRFTLLRHKVSDENTIYKNDIDKLIMHLYARGTKVYAIIDALKCRHISRSRKTIFNTIYRYEVEWMIRAPRKKRRI